MERDKLIYDDDDLFIFDVYNKGSHSAVAPDNEDNYPGDHFAKSAISKGIELRPFTAGPEYLKKLKEAMADVWGPRRCDDTHKTEHWKPDFIFYNAGTDILF